MKNTRFTMTAVLLITCGLLACGCSPGKNAKKDEVAPTKEVEKQSQAVSYYSVPPPQPPAAAPSRMAIKRASGKPGEGIKGANGYGSARGSSYLADGVEGGVDESVMGGVPGGEIGGVVGGMTQPVEIPDKDAKSAELKLERADELLIIEKDKKNTSRASTPSDIAGEATSGTLKARKANGEEIGEFPLKHTEVSADIASFMARTVVKQEYTNPYKDVIEAVYVFPLGAMAAVNDFVMEVGSRRIVGVVRPREEAERIYQEARQRGQTASLLTQERPNLFTQNVANIEPGGSVNITITTFETLRHEKGVWEYVFPMVVGPRYIPGDATSTTSAAKVGGGGWSAPTNVVPDAHNITPPVLKPGQRSGHDIGLTVNLDAGMRITKVWSMAHKIDVAMGTSNRAEVKLADEDAIPNRDFVLRWQVGGEKITVGQVAHRAGKQGYVALLVEPPLDPADADVSPREITFILDVSGSMSGIPVETSKSLVREVLDNLRGDDAFNIFIFAGGNGQLWESARPNTPENIEVAKQFLSNLAGSGGTEMLAGIRRAITGSHDPDRLQMYVFCTDGFVGDEERILSFIKIDRGPARFFAFGIGSSVNRYLIDGVARVGGGSSMVVMPRDEEFAKKAAARFYSLIDAPVLVDARIDWNGLPVVDAFPERLGDLFVGSAFTVVARFTTAATGTAYLRGRVGSKDVRIPIRLELPEAAPGHAELAPVWARHRIADLSEEMLTAQDERHKELVQTITDLAVEFRLASQFTSFVAVDESSIVGNGQPVKVNQPLPMPEGVSYTGVFGETPKPTVGPVTGVKGPGSDR